MIMKDEELTVLLIAEGSGSFARIIRRLEKSGCSCRFASSYAEAQRLVRAQTFELVLSVIPPRENAMSCLTESLAGTHASVFYAHPVEDSCWWLPALRNGFKCFGAPALRPPEFTALLDAVVKQIREDRVSRQTSVPSMPVSQQGIRAKTSEDAARASPAKAA